MSDSDQGPIEQIKEESSQTSAEDFVPSGAFGHNEIPLPPVSGKYLDLDITREIDTDSHELLPLRTRYLVSAAYCASYLLVGIVMASIGPALIMLAENTGSNEADVAFAFPVRCAGGIIGAVLGGYLIERFPANKVLCFTLLLCALGMFALPLCKDIVSLTLTISVGGFTMGLLDSGGNVAMMWLHGAHSKPHIQTLHFCFGVGACLAPLVEVWFTGGTDSSAIRWAFWFSSILFVPVAIALYVLKSPQRESLRSEPSPLTVLGSSPKMTKREWMIAILASILLCLDVGAEVAYGGFIFLYGVRFLDMEERSAAELTSLFWGFLAIGRFLGIFISMKWTPGRMLLVNLIGCFLSSAFITFDFSSVSLLWIMTAFYGLAQASVFPTVLSLVESFMEMTGPAATTCVFGASVGEVLVPLILQRLFSLENQEKLSFLIWILVICSVLSFVVLGIIMPLGWRNQIEREKKVAIALGESGRAPLDQLIIEDAFVLAEMENDENDENLHFP